MQFSFYLLALILGFLLSGGYLLFNSKPFEYQRVNLIVFVILVSGLLSETLWAFTLGINGEQFFLYNFLYVYLGPTLMLMLFTQIPFSCKLERKVLPTIFLFLAFGLINSLYFQPIYSSIQSYSYLTGHGFVLFYSIIFFKDILKQSKFREVNLLSLPYFWIAALVLFSFGENYIFFILTYYFPAIGTYNMGHVFEWVRFFTGLMYLALGLSFYAPFVFKRTYSY